MEDITTNYDQQIYPWNWNICCLERRKKNKILKAAQIEVRSNNNPEKPLIKLYQTGTVISNS